MQNLGYVEAFTAEISDQSYMLFVNRKTNGAGFIDIDFDCSLHKSRVYLFARVKLMHRFVIWFGVYKIQRE